LIESLAVIKSRAKGENVCDITLLKNHFKELLQDDEAKKIFEQKFENDPMLCDGFVTTGGMLSPKPKVLMAIARIVHDLMKQCPIPQLAAVTNTELVHASNRPAEAPRITVPSDGFYQPQVQSGEPLPLMALRSNDIPSDLSRDQHFEPGSNGFLLDGDVEIDLSDTDTLEIVAQVAMPPASIFDNSENRRSLLKKRAGLWPEFIDRTGEAKSRSPRDVFGFNVDIETDLINFDHSEQVLVRIDELETDVPVVGEVRFNLRDFFGQRSQNDAPNASNDNFVEVEAQLIGKDTSVIVRGRCSHKQSFDDTKSRIMTLRARGLSRTAGLFDTVNTLANRTFEQASPLAPSLQSREGASMRLILPATTRPAKCDTLTPHPVFLVTDEVSTDEILKLRKPLVRIKLQRGWFSSGEGEQIGLVVWPPNLKESDTASLNANKVPKRATLDGPSRNMELAMFADDDLGPGGKFVTRRGADPVRGGPRDSRHFLGLDNFSQLEEIDANGETLATYRPNEIMPVDETLANLVTLEDGAQEESAQLQSTLNVGLILFTPRFNMEEEYWYADVDLGPRQASDPFVRLGLVRYQPNTSAALRVSNPVTQWIQLLPERKVTVVSKKDKLKVNVTGLATESAKEIDYKVGPPADESDESSKARIDRQTAAASPLIRAVLARETTNERYGPQRETLVLKTDTETGKEAHAVLITNSVKNGLGNWELDIDRKLLETADPGVQFVLYLEEIEMRRPATYENEPVSPTDLFLDDPFVSSGPRFAMRVELGNFLNSGNASDDQ
jgi:hypothetical protein